MLYRKAPQDHTQTISGAVLARLSASGVFVRLPQKDATLVRTLSDSFKTLEAHARDLARTRFRHSSAALFSKVLPNHLVTRLTSAICNSSYYLSNTSSLDSVTKAILADLSRLASAGLLVSTDQLLGTPVLSREEVPKITRLLVPTANRPEQLARWLNSASDCASHYPHPLTISIADSSSLTVEGLNRARAQTCRQEQGMKVEYIGAYERESLVTYLDQQGFDPIVTRFGLCPDYSLSLATHGTNRNTLQLLSFGHLAFSSDDDVVLTHTHVPADTRVFNKSLPVLCSDPFCWDIYPAQNMHAKAADDNILSSHGAWLGRRVQDALDVTTTFEDSLCSGFIQSLLDERAIIQMTVSSATGDTGMHSSRGIVLSSNPLVRKRLAEDPDFYAAVRDTRQFCKSVDTPCIAHGLHTMAMSFGYDYRTPALPYLPIGRNEDGVFASLMNLCHPERCHVALPDAVSHVPDRQRYNVPAWFDTFRHVRISDVVIALTHLSNCTAYPDASQALGRFFTSVAQLPATSFCLLVRKALADYLHGQLSFVCSYRSGASSAWKADTDKAFSRYIDALSSTAYAVPIDIANETYTLDRTKGIVGVYGQLLLAWSDMCSAALGWRYQGVFE